MRKSKAPRLITVLIATTVTIVFWIFFSVFRIFVSTPPVIVPEELLTPLSPILDTTSLENIEKRVYFEEHEIQEFALPEGIDIPTTSEPTPTILEEEGLEDIEVATNEAELEEEVLP